MKNNEKITIHQIFWYFIIFSVIGLLIETIYCFITTNVLESRKGLIWGPFCPVYGVSTAFLILMLNKQKDKNILWIFFYGFFAGSIAEYCLSFILEAIYGMRFWDYTYTNLHINGRICMQYSIYWGILSVIIIKVIKPILDKIINKTPKKIGVITDIVLFVFFVVNCIFTVWGIQTYQDRVINGESNKIYTNNIIIQVKQKIENDYFTNERISKCFPNLRIKDSNGNEVWVRTLIKENIK